MFLLGVDCGTQSLKVVIWDPVSGQLQSVAEQYEVLDGLPPGHKEQHPQIWIDALEGCIERLRQDGADLTRVSGIGISGQQHGLVVLDEAHQVIRPAKLWCDTSTEAQCRQILERAGSLQSYMEEVGNALPPGFTASKILWIRQNEPEAYARIRYLLLPHDFLNFYLTGELVTEAGDASGTGYFRVRQRHWSQKALVWIDPERDLEGLLPRMIESSQPAGELRLSLAERWGMPSGVLVSSGGGDNMMGAIGSGNVENGIVTVSLGTSGTLFGYSDSPVVDPEGEIAAFCDSTGSWLPLGCTMNVTVATEMVRRGFGPALREEFEAALETVPAGSGGLILLPYLEGERMPNVPEGTGVLLGLRPHTATPGHLARAAVEGVTLGLRHGLERLHQLGVSAREIRLIGGGSRSPAWRQIAADVFGLPVVSPSNLEGPSFGAAIQALWAREGGDIVPLVRRHLLLDERSRCLPRREAQEVYSQIFAVFRRLSRALIESDVFPSHRRFIEGKDGMPNG